MSGQMTELDAVNEILTAVGQQPVQSLVAGTYIEATRIKQILDRTSREVQSKGWWFNEESNTLLQPDTDGYINLALNVIEAEVISDNDGSMVQRGNRIYNKKERTYIFKSAISANIIVLLPWNELPQVAREFITSITKYKYNSGITNLEDIKMDTQAELLDRFKVMRASDTRSRDVNLLRNGRVQNIAFKNRRR